MEVIPQIHQKPATPTLARLIPIASALTLGCLFIPTIQSLYSRWIKWDESQSHGLIVVGIFLFFLYKSSPWQTSTQTQFEKFSTLILLGLASCAWFIFHIINIYILEQLLLLPLLFLILSSIYGWRTSFSHAVLLALPIFAIPIWDQLTDALVNLSGFIVGKMVLLINMPARIDGNSIFIPNGHIVIADGCSGLRYLEIALSLGYIISYLNLYSIARLGGVLLIAIALGLVANWLRIFILVIVGYESNMQSSLMSDHEIFGWLLFACISFPAIYFAPVIHTQDHNQNTSINHPKYLSLLLAILAASLGPLLSLVFNAKPQVTELKDVLRFELQPITAKKMPLAITNPKAMHTENVRTDNKVYIQIDQYQRLKQEDKLVPYIARLYNNETWSLLEQTHINTPAFNAEVSVLHHKTKKTKIAQLQWFKIAGADVTSIAAAKMWQIAALIQNKNHFMIITLQVECKTDDCTNAITQLESTANSLTLNTQGY